MCLERPENYFKIEGIKIKSGNHICDLKTATIELTVIDPKITEKDSGWFTTQLDLKGFTAANSSLKFGEWNNYDLPDKCYVEISFA